VAIVGPINRHEQLSGTDNLPDVDKSLRDLTGDAEAKIAFYTR